MAQEKFGIENLQKVLAFGVKLEQEVKADLADGKFTLAEGLGLLPDLISLPELISSKDAIVAEAKDLSLAEVEQLVASVNGVVTDAKVLETITYALDVIVSVKNLITVIVNKAA